MMAPKPSPEQQERRLKDQDEITEVHRIDYYSESDSESEDIDGQLASAALSSADPALTWLARVESVARAEDRSLERGERRARKGQHRQVQGRTSLPSVLRDSLTDESNDFGESPPRNRRNSAIDVRTATRKSTSVDVGASTAVLGPAFPGKVDNDPAFSERKGLTPEGTPLDLRALVLVTGDGDGDGDGDVNPPGHICARASEAGGDQRPPALDPVSPRAYVQAQRNAPRTPVWEMVSNPADGRFSLTSPLRRLEHEQRTDSMRNSWGPNDTWGGVS